MFNAHLPRAPDEFADLNEDMDVLQEVAEIQTCISNVILSSVPGISLFSAFIVVGACKACS